MKTETNQPTAWQRLAAAARQVAADKDAQMPVGFATRVAAIAFARVEPTLTALFAQFAWKALGIAALLMLGTVALNLGTAVKAIEGDDTHVDAALTDPVGEYINAADAQP